MIIEHLRWIMSPYLLHLYLLVVLFVPLLSEVQDGLQCSFPGEEWRFDCLPQGNVTKTKCLSRGCCWSLSIQPTGSLKDLKIPPCYFPQNYTTYAVVSIEERFASVQVNATLKRSSLFKKDVKTLTADFIKDSDTVLRIRIRDAYNDRWEPPPLTKSWKNPSWEHGPHRVPKLYVKWANIQEQFGFIVYDDTGCILLQTVGAFIFSDQFLQLSHLIPSHTIYGLGQRQDRLILNTTWSKYTLWNHDGHHIYDNINLYGSHPFYMCKADQRWYGLFMYSSNAMDVLLQPIPAVTWRMIGGIFDMYIFIGSTPADVIAQYHFLIGTPSLPPYWSLGFHLCAQRYGSAQRTLDVVERMRKLQIPQDTQWNDIEYAYKRRVFTRDEARFGNQSWLAKALHSLHMHYVIQTDCGISNKAPTGTYKPYDLGQKMDLFIKDMNGKNLVGIVWPGSTVWPDFLSNKSQAYWLELVSTFHSQVPFDGMWLDLNEICNFFNGSIHGCPYNSSLDFPPYLPDVYGKTLFTKTICPSAQHQMSSHYNVHNLYSLYEAMRSFTALKEVRKQRPFVISRSSFPGMGRYAGTWSGDNKSSWYDMYKSISAMLHMNMYGVPLTGSDICGFHDNTTEELCTRWQQLGAFYSFSRNHHADDTTVQDPTAFSTASIDSTRKALTTRYSLIPYLYTLMWFSHSEAQTVIRPLFFEFPEDVKTHNLDSQFLWGPALMISPVLKQDERHVWAYFPKAVWYDFYSGRRVTTVGQYVKLPAPFDVINLHVRGGSILITQHPAQTTYESRKLPFGLIVALDSSDSAFGYHYSDDGISLMADDSHQYNLLVYHVQKGSLQSQWIKLGYSSQPMILGNITIFGLTFHPSQVTLNNQSVSYQWTDSVLYIPSLHFDLLKESLVVKWEK